MNWEPAHADHSIDSVNVLVTLSEPMDSDAFDDVIIPVRKAALAHGLGTRIESQEPIEIPVGPGQAVFTVNVNTPIPTSRRVAFQRVAENTVVSEFNIGVRSFAMGTTRYQRWAQFFSQFRDIVSAVDGSWPVAQRVKAIQLQYVDRFLSVPGGASHLEVLAENPPSLRIPQEDPNAAFHVHTGWFDYQSEPNIRVLTNINIDASDARAPHLAGQRRNLTVLTLLQHESLGTNLNNPVDRTDLLHQRLKNLFRHLISKEAAARVGLSE